MPEARWEFPADPASPAAARREVEAVLTSWDATGLVWAATTVVSELATNAVLHARTPFTVAMSLQGDVLRVEVSDRSLRRPQPRTYDDEATTGRGLALLAALAGDTGVDLTDGGKTIWCELTPTGTGGARSGGRPDAADDEGSDVEGHGGQVPDARSGEPAQLSSEVPPAPALHTWPGERAA